MKLTRCLQPDNLGSKQERLEWKDNYTSKNNCISKGKKVNKIMHEYCFYLPWVSPASQIWLWPTKSSRLIWPNQEKNEEWRDLRISDTFLKITNEIIYKRNHQNDIDKMIWNEDLLLVGIIWYFISWYLTGIKTM